jgi:enoyl-CoA hydratase/carnithine racemase
MSNVVLVETKGSVYYVTINRPDKLNALSWEVWQELGKAFDAFEKSDARVCVLSGSGKKAFVAGADIDAYRTMSTKEFSEFIVEAGKIANRIYEIPKPFIAAIYGYALGGGLELALHCDLVVANKSAKLGLPEANLGLLPGGGGTQIVPRLIGVAKTNDMIMRGRWLRGEEALNCGLISSIFDDEKYEVNGHMYRIVDILKALNKVLDARESSRIKGNSNRIIHLVDQIFQKDVKYKDGIY